MIIIRLYIAEYIEPTARGQPPNKGQNVRSHTKCPLLGCTTEILKEYLKHCIVLYSAGAGMLYCDFLHYNNSQHASMSRNRFVLHCI